MSKFFGIQIPEVLPHFFGFPWEQRVLQTPPVQSGGLTGHFSIEGAIPVATARPQAVSYGGKEYQQLTLVFTGSIQNTGNVPTPALVPVMQTINSGAPTRSSWNGISGSAIPPIQPGQSGTFTVKQAQPMKGNDPVGDLSVVVKLVPQDSIPTFSAIGSAPAFLGQQLSQSIGKVTPQQSISLGGDFGAGDTTGGTTGTVVATTKFKVGDQVHNSSRVGNISAIGPIDPGNGQLYSVKWTQVTYTSSFTAGQTQDNIPEATLSSGSIILDQDNAQNFNNQIQAATTKDQLETIYGQVKTSYQNQRLTDASYGLLTTAYTTKLAALTAAAVVIDDPARFLAQIQSANTPAALETYWLAIAASYAAGKLTKAQHDSLFAAYQLRASQLYQSTYTDSAMVSGYVVMPVLAVGAPFKYTSQPQYTGKVATIYPLGTYGTKDQVVNVKWDGAWPGGFPGQFSDVSAADIMLV